VAASKLGWGDTTQFHTTTMVYGNCMPNGVRMEVVVSTGAIRCAKLHSNRYHQETNTHLFTSWMPSEEIWTHR